MRGLRALSQASSLAAQGPGGSAIVPILHWDLDPHSSGNPRGLQHRSLAARPLSPHLMGSMGDRVADGRHCPWGQGRGWAGQTQSWALTATLWPFPSWSLLPRAEVTDKGPPAGHKSLGLYDPQGHLRERTLAVAVGTRTHEEQLKNGGTPVEGRGCGAPQSCGSGGVSKAVPTSQGRGGRCESGLFRAGGMAHWAPSLPGSPMWPCPAEMVSDQLWRSPWRPRAGPLLCKEA